MTPPQTPSRSSVSGVTPEVATSTTSAGEALVGDDQVGAAAEHQHGLAVRVGGRDGVDQLRLGAWRAPSRGPARRVAAWCGRRGPAQARTTALGMPSTFSPLQVTSRAMVARPSSTFFTCRRRRSRPPPSAGTTTGLVNLQPSSTTSASGPRGTARAGERQGVHAVGDHAGQPDAAGDLLVLVDRVVVAARLGVGDQVGAGHGVDDRLEASPAFMRHRPVDQGGLRRADQRAVGVGDRAGGADDVVAADLAQRRHGQGGGEQVAEHDRALVGEPLLAVDDPEQVDLLGGQEGVHRVEGQHDREGRRAPGRRRTRPPVAAANAAHLSSVTTYGGVGGNSRPTRDWSTGMPST